MIELEKDVESYLKNQVERRGGICLKFPTIHTEGIPDRIILMPKGRMVFCELKRPKGGRLSEIQKYQIGKLRALGFKVEVVNTKKAIDDLLDWVEHGEE